MDILVQLTGDSVTVRCKPEIRVFHIFYLLVNFILNIKPVNCWVRAYLLFYIQFLRNFIDFRQNLCCNII